MEDICCVDFGDCCVDLEAQFVFKPGYSLLYCSIQDLLMVQSYDRCSTSLLHNLVHAKMHACCWTCKCWVELCICGKKEQRLTIHEQTVCVCVCVCVCGIKIRVGGAYGCSSLSHWLTHPPSWKQTSSKAERGTTGSKINFSFYS